MVSQEDKDAIRAAFDEGNKQTLTPEQKRAQKLEQVRGLLAKADAATDPGEADVFRAGADRLMNQFAIDQWMVDQAQDGVNARPKPEIRLFSFSWWYKSDRHQDLYEMFLSVANHCRCVVATRGRGKNGDYGQMPVIGIPSDLDWFDLLFTNLMLQMARQLEPKPDPDKSFDENAYVLRLSGMAKPRLGKLMWEAKILAPGMAAEQMDEPWNARKDSNGRMVNRTMGRYIKALRTGAERWANSNSLDTTIVGTGTTGTVVWQRSFSYGFVREISSRLRAMRRANEKPSDGPSVAIALRDIRQVAEELYAETWPDLCHGCGNHVTACTCKCSKCHKLYAECSCPVKTSRSLSRTVVVDGRGMAAGRRAGAQADISGHGQRRMGGQKQIGG